VHKLTGLHGLLRLLKEPSVRHNSSVTCFCFCRCDGLTAQACSQSHYANGRQSPYPRVGRQTAPYECPVAVGLERGYLEGKVGAPV
jgi:hypothetical protein